MIIDMTHTVVIKQRLFEYHGNRFQMRVVPDEDHGPPCESHAAAYIEQVALELAELEHIEPVAPVATAGVRPHGSV